MKYVIASVDIRGCHRSKTPWYAAESIVYRQVLEIEEIRLSVESMRLEMNAWAHILVVNESSRLSVVRRHRTHAYPPQQRLDRMDNHNQIRIRLHLHWQSSPTSHTNERVIYGI